MPRRARPAVLLGLFALGACSARETPPPRPDAGGGPADGSADGALDAPLDGLDDVLPDAAPEGSVDALPDAPADALAEAGDDGAPDAPPDVPPDAGMSCDAMDAAGEGVCATVLGYAWSGGECVGVSGCTCAGADCDLLHETLVECLAAHSDCPTDCTVTGCPDGEDCLYCWVGWACLPEGAVC